MKTLMIFAAALIVLTSCTESTQILAGATERELCRSWGESLPTRSRMDTQQTQDEIQMGYAKFEAACPSHEHLIP